MDARVKPGHDESGGGDVSEEAVGGRGRLPAASDPDHEPETAGAAGTTGV